MGFSTSLPLTFSASYYIDEISPVAELSEFVQVKLSADRTYLPDIKVHPHWSVLFNLVSRGCPTRASRWLTESILEMYKVSSAINDPESNHFEYIIPKVTEDTAKDIKHSLNVIAGFQKAICWLLGAGQIKTAETVTLCVVKEHRLYSTLLK